MMMINDRYPSLTHADFYIAGDEDQFTSHLTDHDVHHISPHTLPMFRHIFHTLKKGIFIAIRDSELKVFLPFCKVHYINNFSSIQLPTVFSGNVKNMDQYLCLTERNKSSSNHIASRLNWYCGGHTIRYTVDKTERLTNVATLHHMMLCIVSERIVPTDCDFFINRRDHPLIRMNNYDPYWNKIPIEYPLSTKNGVLSMCTNPRHFEDACIPTYEDWIRTNAFMKFPHARLPDDLLDYLNNQTLDNIDKEWSQKKSIAIFRGSNTGDHNRIRLMETFQHETQYFDVGLSNIRMRPTVDVKNDTLEVPNPEYLREFIRPVVSMKEQAQGWKYVVHIAGHVEAFRLSCELGYGCVILLVDNPWTTYFKSMLVPFVHYVPIKSDMSDLMDNVRNLQENDSLAKNIARNAFLFYRNSMQRDDVLDSSARIIRKCSHQKISDPLLTIFQQNAKKFAENFSPMKIFAPNENNFFKKNLKKNSEKYFENIFSLAVDAYRSAAWYVGIIDDDDNVILMYPRYKMTLMDYVKSNDSTFKDCIQIARRILADIINLQRLGIYHMDLTLWNIVMNSPTDIRIIDFGRAYVKEWNACILVGDPERERPYERDVSVFMFSLFHDLLKYKSLQKNEIKYIFDFMFRFFPMIEKPLVNSVTTLKETLNVLKKFTSAGYCGLSHLRRKDGGGGVWTEEDVNAMINF